jgi:SAM-dependent methyltransferase
MNLPYSGTELELFATANNWKRYVATFIAPHIGERVLDVGAGIGSHIPFLFGIGVRDWVCLEPDQELASRLARDIADRELPAACRVVTGTLDQIGEMELFDTILYLDVLEHIAEDRVEIERAARRLTEGGSLVVLAPAHGFLYSAFDRAIGHHRRYSAAGLRALAPPECRIISCRSLDSAGFFASLGNRVLLRSAAPTPAQVAFWDKILVPISRRLDRHLNYRFGKSVLAVWKVAPSTPFGDRSGNEI